ncbi:MAG: hypothetical protein AB2L21_09740 [Anaerolineaceae bacterium]
MSISKNLRGVQYGRFKKLARDKIPDIIDNKAKCIVTLSDNKHLFKFDKKLIEKIKEYQESKGMEELADVGEVI